MSLIYHYRWYFLGFFVGVGSYILSYILFPFAFSILSINLTSNKNDVIIHAEELAKKQNFLSEEFYTSVSFETDSHAKTFIEKAYGKDIFFKIITDDLYQPYQWHVRLFLPNTISEQSFFFTPDNRAYGFKTKIPDSFVSKNISENEAILLALNAASFYNIDLNNYILVAPSSKIAPSGRIDYTFIYERKENSLGEGKYHVKIIVSGDQVSTVLQYIQVPESFEKKYQEERSLNDFLAHIALLCMFLFFIIIGGGFGLFYLFKNNFLIIRPALFLGCTGGILTFLYHCNMLPLMWMSYQTTQSISSFLISKLNYTLISSFSTFGSYFFIIMIAEGLTRKAFGAHPQFWLSWTDNVGTDLTCAQTIISYICTGILLNFVVIFYFFTTRFFGWWIPIDTLINPNMLATHFPSLFPITMAFSAGILEECLCRAIPLAGVILIGKYYNQKKLFLSIGFILQIIIFSAAHANYPSSPYYARLIELIIPSSIFGMIYLFFGLLPTIMTHVFYDLILMALPLFVSDAKNIFFHQAIIIIIGLAPLLIVLYYQYKKNHIQKVIINSDWIIPAKAPIIKQVLSTKHITLFSKRLWACTMIGIMSGILLVYLNKNFNVNYNNTIQKPISNQVSKKHQLPFIAYHGGNNSDFLQHRYIWQKSPQLYQELINQGFLKKPCWVIRYAQFDGSIADRIAETYLFYDNNMVYRQKIIVPQNEALLTLTEQEAVKLAYEKILQEYKLTQDDVTLIGKNSFKQVNRTDWNIIFETKQTNNPEISQRILIIITGPNITDYSKYIYIPEIWSRMNDHEAGIFNNAVFVFFILFIMIILLGLYQASTTIVFETIAWKKLFIAVLILVVLGILNLCNNWNILFINFSTMASIRTQAIKLFFMNLLQLIVQSGLMVTALFFSLCSWQSTYLFKRILTNNTGSRWLTFKNQIKSNFYTNFHYILATIGSTFFLITLLFLIKKFFYSKNLFIPYLSYQEAFFPSFYITYQSLITFLSFTLIFTLTDHAIIYITNEWRKNYFVAFLFSSIIGSIIALQIPFFVPITLYELLVYGFIFGAGFITMYQLILRYDRFNFLLISLIFTILSINLQMYPLSFYYQWSIYCFPAFLLPFLGKKILQKQFFT